MKHHFIPYIYIIFLLIYSIETSSQEIYLEIDSKTDAEKLILKKINYQKKHRDSIDIISEIQSISSYLKQIGYLTNTFDSIIKKEKNTRIAYFSLNEKIENIFIKVTKNNTFFFKNREIKKERVKIPFENLQNTLYKISQSLNKEGRPFSKVQLKNLTIRNKSLFADLEVLKSKKRTINKTIVKGYEEFPKSFLKNYFKINNQTLFNKEKIEEISLLSKNLKFAKEIKSPEFLFTKDSTLLYIYLKKQQNSNFDAIVNFTQKEDGGVLFNGIVDLELNNILNSGENFNLLWNSIGEERQEFKLSIETPYIFNSKYSPEISFLIYKQDSTFLNTKFNTKLFYEINPKTKIGFTYDAENSQNLKEAIDNNIETYNNYFLGLQFSYSIPKNDSFFNNKLYLEINPSLGERKTSETQSTQFKLKIIASYIWDLNSRASIFLKNETGYLKSDNFIDNELFRIGGANSIRGFNEQSIFTNSYTFFNIEFRYLTSNQAYLYSITDYGTLLANSTNKNLLGLGLGYKFTLKKSQLNIGAVVGKEGSNKIDTNNLKLIFTWKNSF